MWRYFLVITNGNLAVEKSISLIVKIHVGKGREQLSTEMVIVAC